MGITVKSRIFFRKKEIQVYGNAGTIGRREPGEPELCMGTLDVKGKGKNKYNTVNSIYWGGEHHFDQNEEFVVLEISTGGKPYVNETVTYRNVYLKLSDGTVVKNK